MHNASAPIKLLIRRCIPWLSYTYYAMVHIIYHIYIIQILSVCLSVKYRRPNGWTDHDQIWHACADRSGNGSYLKKLNPTPGGGVGILGGNFFQKSGTFHELPRKSIKKSYPPPTKGGRSANFRGSTFQKSGK